MVLGPKKRLKSLFQTKDFGKAYSKLGMDPAILTSRRNAKTRGIAMAKKSERRNKKAPGTGDDSQNSKSPVNVNLHEHRTIQKKRGNK